MAQKMHIPSTNPLASASSTAPAADDDLYSAGDAAESPAMHPTVPSVAAHVDDLYDLPNSASHPGTLLLLPPATAPTTSPTVAYDGVSASSQRHEASVDRRHLSGPSASESAFAAISSSSKPLGKIAVDMVSAFVTKLRTEFRDGTMIPKAYKERVEALTAATLASTASPPAASPAVAVAPGALPTITNIIEPGYAFPLYPWMKLAVILFRDASQSALEGAGEAAEEEDPEALTAALGRGIDSIVDQSAYAIGDLAGCIFRSCFLSREYTQALVETVVRPALRDLVIDRVMPRLRYASSIAVGEQQRGTGVMVVASLRTVLSSALETLCVGWLASWYPYLLHVVRSGRENFLVALASPAHGGDGEFGSTAAAVAHHSRVHPVMALLQASEWIATVRRAAGRRDRFAETQDGVFPNTVLVPVWWLDDVVRWLGSHANPEAHAKRPPSSVQETAADASYSSSSSPHAVAPLPAVPTWKLVALDSAAASLTFEPRRRTADATVSALMGTSAAFLPDGTFNVLWEMFGGGPKITVPNRRCGEHLLRLQSIPEPRVSVQLAVRGSLLQRIVPAHLQPQSTRPVDPLYEEDDSLLTSLDSPSSVAREQLPTLTLREVRAPLYTSVRDVMLHLLSEVPRIASALQLDDATSAALHRSLVYGHFSVSVEVVSLSNPAQPAAMASRTFRERPGAKQHVVDMNVSVGTYLPTTILADQIMILCVDDAQFAFTPSFDPTATSVGKCGLVNLGNTCFMNSGLQCLSNLPLFRVALLSDSPTMRQPQHCCPLLSAFNGLIRELWAVPPSSSSYHFYSANPVKFKTAIGRQCARFAGYEQQDAIEFIEVLLDRLHDELNPVEKKRFRERTDADNGIDVATLSKLYWADFLENNNTWITRLCYRQEKTRFQCLECNFSSTVFDAQGSLSVPITEESFYSIDVPVYVCPDLSHEAEISAPSAATKAITPLMVRVRIPQESQMAVILVELRRLLTEAGIVGRTEDEQGEVSLYYRFATGNGNWMLAAATTPSMAKILANYSYRCYVLRSYRRVARSSTIINLNTKDSAAAAGVSSAAPAHERDTVATAPTREASESVGLSPTASSTGKRNGNGGAAESTALVSRVAFFVHDGTELSANGITYRSTSHVPVDNRFVEMIHIQCFLRTGTTNRDVYDVAKRVFDAYCRPQRSKAAALGNDDESLALRDENAVKCGKTGASLAEQLTETATTKEETESNPSPSHGPEQLTAAVVAETEVVEEAFVIHVVKTTTDRDKDPPLLADDEPFPFLTHSYSEMIPMKVVVHVDGKRFAKPQPVEPELHETMRTVVSNEEALERTRAEGGLTLMKCLRNLRERHVLKGDDAWYCPKCKAHKESITDSSQFILPDILTVHLKRFKANSFGGLTKIETVVQFPLELDARGLLADELSPLGDASPLRGGSEAATSSSSSSSEYFLRGVVYHSGSLAFGHYTARAFCDGAGEWIHYNDSQATSATAPHPEQAYILFYQRRQTDEVMPAAYYRGSGNVPDLIRGSGSVMGGVGSTTLGTDSINSLD